ncbi:MAG: hypothetical protein ACRDQ5_23570, partial [Sciscionella sp.]
MSLPVVSRRWECPSDRARSGSKQDRHKIVFGGTRPVDGLLRYGFTLFGERVSYAEFFGQLCA